MDIFSIIEENVKPLGVGKDGSQVRHQINPDDILNKMVHGPADLVALMQDYRNPLYETARIFYIRDEKIVSVESYSNHLPGFSRLGSGTFGETKERIQRHQTKLNADGFYLLHNHPSGDPTPSIDDIWLTCTLSFSNNGFLGHIVIDHTKFTLIDENGKTTLLDVPNHYEKDIFHQPTLEHPLLQETVSSPEEVAEVGRKLIDYRDDISIAIFSDPKGKIAAFSEFSNKLAENKELMQAYTEKGMMDYGAARVFILTTSEAAYEHRKELVEKAFATDVFFLDEMGFFWNAHEENIQKKPEYIFAGKSIMEIPLQEELYSLEERVDENDIELER